MQLESHIAKVNVQLKDEYLIYANYERLISIYEFNVQKYESLTNNYYSYELSKMYRQVAYLIINTGDIDKFRVAREYLEKAIIIIENLFYTSQDFVDLYCDIYYLYSIVFEHQGNVEEAYNICDNAICGIEKRNLDVLKPDTLLRQVYLLTSDEKIIIDINENTTTTDLFEIFQNKRRLFQFYLRIHEIIKAKNVLKELESVVLLLGNRLDKIYVGMYYRDLAKYYFISNEIGESKMYFKKALRFFDYYAFEGQKKMILLDNEQYRFNVEEFERRSVYD